MTDTRYDHRTNGQVELEEEDVDEKPNLYAGLGALVVASGLIVALAVVIGLLAAVWWYLFLAGWSVVW